MNDRTLHFAGGDGTELAGSLRLPSAEGRTFPGVLLVAGSGPTDRNGNNPLSARRLDTLKLIAERLAEAQIASLRFDKRGVGASTVAPRDVEAKARFFRWDNAIHDVVAAHGALSDQPTVDVHCTGLLGHSEGGLLALAAAPRTRDAPRGIVLAATPGRPLGHIIRRQVARRHPLLLAEVEHGLAEIGATGRPPSATAMTRLFPPYIGPYLQHAMAFDPVEALTAVDAKCLLVQGTADRQVVPMDDIQPMVDVLTGGRPDSDILIAPSVCHALHRASSREGDPRLAPVVADGISSWLRANLI